MKAKRLFLGLAAFGVALSPVMASAATQTGSTTINASVAKVISMTATSPATIPEITPTSGGVVSSTSHTVSVSTNSTNGYVLSMKDSDTTTSMTASGGTIPTHAGTSAAPTALANNTWGYAVAGGAFDATYTAENNNGSSTSKWAGVPSSSGTAVTIKTTNTTATNDQSTIWYGVKVTSSQPSGAYTNSVTYTATTN